MKQITLSLTLSILFLAVKAQSSFELPQRVRMKTAADYTKYEPVVIEAAKWLEETDLNKELSKRKQADAFVAAWVEGSPTISVEITKDLKKLYGKNTQLLYVYMANYAKNFLEDRNNATKLTARKAGLISMMNVYKKGIGVSRSKDMQKLIQITEQNKLDEYVQTTKG